MNGDDRFARQWRIEGTVQGAGVRPALARAARELHLTGRIFNTASGVTAILEGTLDHLDGFEDAFRRQLPSRVILNDVTVQPMATMGFAELSIPQETPSAGERPNLLSTSVPADSRICDACQTELSTSSDRRADYPLLTCAECGPRFTIIRAMPFERTQTSMNAFSMCSKCLAEYRSVADRRFHAQTIACNECGPQMWAERPSGLEEEKVFGSEAVAWAVSVLRQGQIVALRGVGGYQLLVDAMNRDGVSRLRHRKQRAEKPFAILVADLEHASRIAVLSEKEAEVLCSVENPILLVRRRATSAIADNIHPGLREVGIMLPTTGIHERLVSEFGRPLVCTSANASGDPIIYEVSCATYELATIADLFLHHDRPILRPLDDTVARVMAGHVVYLRLARGAAPLRINLPIQQSIVALGGQLKSAIAWTNGSQAVLGPYLGDLESVASRQRFVHHVNDMTQLYRVDADLWLHDLHPDYFTSRWAIEDGRPTWAVPHHEAHVAAGILEHQLWHRPLVGFAWDGAGWSEEGIVSGGEVYAVEGSGTMSRVASWRPFVLPGGDLAAREPWRIALSLLDQCQDAETVELFARQRFPHRPSKELLQWIRRDRTLTKTTSVGRIFDGVAAICLGLCRLEFEGQAAMLLEALADEQASGVYPVPVEMISGSKHPVASSQLAEIDWRPMIRSILGDHLRGVSPGTISQRFHRSLAGVVRNLADRFGDWPIVLGGGVFQNRVLVELCADSVGAGRFHISTAIPPNDGGLAAGQLAWFAMRSGELAR